MDARRNKRLLIRLLRRDVESSYEAQWTLLKRVRRDRTRGLFKSEPIHVLLHRSVLVMLPAFIYILIIYMVIVFQSLKAGHINVVAHAEKEGIMGSMHVLAVYYEVILGGLLFIIESASERVRAEYLLDAPSVFWLDSAVHTASRTSKSRIELANNLLSLPVYLSTAKSILYSIGALVSYLLFLVLLPDLPAVFSESFYIVLGVLLSFPLMFNIVWLFNSPASGIFEVLHSTGENLLRKNRYKKVIFKISDIQILKSFLYAKIYSLIIWIIDRIIPILIFLIIVIITTIVSNISLLFAVCAGVISIALSYVLFHADRDVRENTRGLQFLKIGLLILLPLVLAGYYRFEPSYEVVRVISNILVFIAVIIFYGLSISAIGDVIPSFKKEKRPLLAYLHSYANYVAEELLERREEEGELKAELAYLLLFQYASEVAVECLLSYREDSDCDDYGDCSGSYSIREGYMQLVRDSKLLTLLRHKGEWFLGGDAVSSGILVIMSSVVAVRSMVAYPEYSGFPDDCPLVQRRVVHNVDVLGEALTRLYSLGLYVEDLVTEVELASMIRNARTSLLKYLVESLKRVNCLVLRRMLESPSKFLFLDPDAPKRVLGGEPAEAIEEDVRVFLRAAARTAGRNLALIEGSAAGA